MRDMRARMAWMIAVGALFAGASPIAGQAMNMNFFLVVETPGAGNFGQVIMADSFCHDPGYAAGFGDMVWKAYLTGTEADGEAGEVARERIGSGPWYNFAGVMIAENLEQLHSDANNLNRNTALTLDGQPAPASVPDLPAGSQLDGTAFTADGPLLCFGVR
jgi:hypothetical protein